MRTGIAGLLLFAALTSAAVPYSSKPVPSAPSANVRSNAGAVRHLLNAKKGSIRDLSKAAKVHSMKPEDAVNKLRKAGKSRLPKDMSGLRRAFSSGKNAAVEMLRTNTRAAVSDWKSNLATYKAYDTPERRKLLQLPALQGTTEQKNLCKDLGWDLIALEYDLATDKAVTFTKGCGYEDMFYGAWPSFATPGPGKCFSTDMSSTDTYPCFDNTAYNKFCTGCGADGYYEKTMGLIWKYQGKLHVSFVRMYKNISEGERVTSMKPEV